MNTNASFNRFRARCRANVVCLNPWPSARGETWHRAYDAALAVYEGTSPTATFDEWQRAHDRAHDAALAACHKIT